MLLLSLFLGVLILLPLLILSYIKWQHKYWTRREVPYIIPTSIWGNLKNPFKHKFGLDHTVKEAYLEFKRRGNQHGGIYVFTKAIYIPVDPELIKNVLTKDFQHFNGDGFPHYCENNALGVHLFNLDGNKWMNTRTKLMPNFTPTKIKQIFSSLLECSGPLTYQIDTASKKNKSLNIKEIMSTFTLDVISSCVYGLECHHLNEPNIEFKKYSHQVTTTASWSNFYNFIKFLAPSVWKIIYAKKVPTEVEIFLVNMVRGIWNYRKSKGVSRSDFMQFFLELEEQGRNSRQKSLTIEQITTQAYIFFVGGFETVATTMTFILHEVAYNQEIQNTLREEIRRVMKKYNGKLTYDGIMEMKYLDQVICETLRKYPPIPFLKRICSKDYKVPKTDFTIKKGTTVIISSLGIHQDPNYFPNPEKFDPERFTEENKSNRPAFTFLPFGEGPRTCIGQLFGLMQTKMGISLLLHNYKFSPSSSGNYNIQFESSCRILTATEPIKLNAVRLSEHITRYY